MTLKTLRGRCTATPFNRFGNWVMNGSFDDHSVDKLPRPVLDLRKAHRSGVGCGRAVGERDLFPIALVFFKKIGATRVAS